MKIYELIEGVSEEEIIERIEKNGNNNVILFKKVLAELKTIIPYMSDITVNSKKVNGKVLMYGERKSDNETIPLEFYGWQTWLGMSINEKLIKRKENHVKVLENIIHEMTYVSFRDAFRKSDNECILKLRSISKDDYDDYGLNDDKVKDIIKKIKKLS